MDEERAFIRAILSNPEDSAPWLVYADWLDDRADPRAEFLRLTVAAAETPDAAVRTRSESRIRALRATLDSRWLALLDRAVLELCEFRFDYECPMRWERLEPTDDEFVRFCGECRREVHYCRSLKQARRCVRQGLCVALDPSIPRHPGDLQREDARRPRNRRVVRLGMGGGSKGPPRPDPEDEPFPERRPRPNPRQRSDSEE